MSGEGRKRILVMPEYGIDVTLWERSDYPHDTAREVAGLSPQLVERLRAWNAQWLKANDRPEKPMTRWSPAQARAWTQLGHRLARQLQAELPEVEILVEDDSGENVAIMDLSGERAHVVRVPDASLPRRAYVDASVVRRADRPDDPMHLGQEVLDAGGHAEQSRIRGGARSEPPPLPYSPPQSAT